MNCKPVAIIILLFFSTTIFAQTIEQTIQTDSTNNPLNETTITITNQQNHNKTNLKTNSTGIATYKTTANKSGPNAFTINTSKNGYQETTKTVKVTVTQPFDYDSDKDGWSDIEEKILGTNPFDAGSNYTKSISTAADIACNTNTLIVFEKIQNIDKNQFNSLIQSIQSNNSISQSIQSIGTTSVSIQSIELSNGLSEIRNAQIVKNEQGTIIASYKDNEKTADLFIITPFCTGFITGIPFGFKGGVSGDAAFITGLGSMTAHSEELNQAMQQVTQDLLPIILIPPPLNTIALQNLLIKYRIPQSIASSAITFSNYLKSLADKTNTKYYDPINYNSYFIGFNSGYLSGWLTEQVILGKTIGTIFKWSLKALTTIGELTLKYGSITAKTISETIAGKWIIENGSIDAIEGLKQFGANEKGIINPTLSGTGEIVGKNLEKFNQIAKAQPELETALKTIQSNEKLAQLSLNWTTEETKNAATIIKNYPDLWQDVATYGGKLEETIKIEKINNELRWLEEGWVNANGNGFGWEKIWKKHVTGEVSGGTLFKEAGIANENVEKTIFDTIKNPTEGTLRSSNGGWCYFSKAANGFFVIVVTTKNGSINTSYPRKDIICG